MQYFLYTTYLSVRVLYKFTTKEEAVKKLQELIEYYGVGLIYKLIEGNEIGVE